MDGRRWLHGLWAVVVGNAVYFVLLWRWLPEAWRHRPFVLDRGLGVDFLLCLGFYLLLRLLGPARRR